MDNSELLRRLRQIASVGLLSFGLITAACAIPSPSLITDDRTPNSPTPLSSRGIPATEQTELSQLLTQINQSVEQDKKRQLLEEAFNLAVNDPDLITNFIAVCDDRSLMEKALKVRYTYRIYSLKEKLTTIHFFDNTIIILSPINLENVKIYQQDHKPLQNDALGTYAINNHVPLELVTVANELYDTYRQRLPTKSSPQSITSALKTHVFPSDGRANPVDLSSNMGLIDWIITNNFSQQQLK